jgi:hypothetical protein
VTPASLPAARLPAFRVRKKRGSIAEPPFQFNRSAGRPALRKAQFASLTRTQRFSFEIGADSSMRTVWPTFAAFASSWAW